MFSVEKSPMKFFMEEMFNGNSLRNTTTLGNEKERERVYDTIFRLPWRCELVKALLSFQDPLEKTLNILHTKSLRCISIPVHLIELDSL